MEVQLEKGEKMGGKTEELQETAWRFGGWRGKAGRASWEKSELSLGKRTSGGGLRGTGQGECVPHPHPVSMSLLCL